MDPMTAILILTAAGVGISSITKGIDTWLQLRGGSQQLNLQKAMMENEAMTAKLANEENRRQADQFMTMIQQEKTEARKEKSKDRQMGLLATMLQTSGQFQQNAANATIQSQRELPPTSIVSLLRGW